MSVREVTEWDRTLAVVCEQCPVCRHARKSQKGMAFQFVKTVETGICPFCCAYERVNGRKAQGKRRDQSPHL